MRPSVDHPDTAFVQWDACSIPFLLLPAQAFCVSSVLLALTTIRAGLDLQFARKIGDQHVPCGLGSEAVHDTLSARNAATAS